MGKNPAVVARARDREEADHKGAQENSGGY